MKGNYLVLTDEQLKIFNERYEFLMMGEGVLTRTTNYDRIVFHEFNKPFPVITTINDKKYTFKITIRAMKLWKENEDLQKTKTLIDVQNAINKVLVSSQNIEDSAILEKLK